jgi:hypothetical protein
MFEYGNDLSLMDLSAVSSASWNNNVDSKVTDIIELPSMHVVTTKGAHSSTKQQMKSQTSDRESDNATALLLPKQMEKTNQVASSTDIGRSDNEPPAPKKRCKVCGSDRWPRAKEHKNDHIVEDLAVPVLLPTNHHRNDRDDTDTEGCNSFVLLLELWLLKPRKRKRRLQQQIEYMDEEIEVIDQQRQHILLAEGKRTRRHKRRSSSNEKPRVVTPDDTRRKIKKLRVRRQGSSSKFCGPNSSGHDQEPKGMEPPRVTLPDELASVIECGSPQRQTGPPAKEPSFRVPETAREPQDQKRRAVELALKIKGFLKDSDTDDGSSSDDTTLLLRRFYPPRRSC